MKPINNNQVINNCPQRASENCKNILPGKFKNELTAKNERICSKKSLARQSRTALPSPGKDRGHLNTDANIDDDDFERQAAIDHMISN